MKTRLLTALMPKIMAVVLALPMGACSADQEVPAASASAYTLGTASRDGIGKFYMGREISHVMGHLGATWLERESRVPEERTDLLLENLPLADGSVVVDLGAGTGYFSLPIAERVPGGRVLSVDLQPEMLAIIGQRSEMAGIENVERIQATEQSPNLPAGEVDLVLIVDAYHEFSHPLEVMQGVAASLKPDGRLYLVEYRGEDPIVPIKPLHKMTQEQAKKEMRAAGLEWVETLDFLPRQHVLVFRRVASQG